jgi:hypothetical protein
VIFILQSPPGILPRLQLILRTYSLTTRPFSQDRPSISFLFPVDKYLPPFLLLSSIVHLHRTSVDTHINRHRQPQPYHCPPSCKLHSRPQVHPPQPTQYQHYPKNCHRISSQASCPRDDVHFPDDLAPWGIGRVPPNIPVFEDIGDEVPTIDQTSTLRIGVGKSHYQWQRSRYQGWEFGCCACGHATSVRQHEKLVVDFICDLFSCRT